MTLTVTCESAARYADAERVAAACGVTVADCVPADSRYELAFTDSDVRLRSVKGEHGDILVNFCAGSAAHRRQYGGGKSQMIAKAVGIKDKIRPQIYDLTAGLGGDAFVLAGLGCDVHMFERNPVVHALLDDGLHRARVFATAEDPELLAVVERMHLCAEDSQHFLQRLGDKAPVIYLDPMFPERKKSASVKKEMQAFHEIVGADEDADSLLELALAAAANRVVVKRPRIAPALAGPASSYCLQGKSSRYDIYALKKLE